MTLRAWCQGLRNIIRAKKARISQDPKHQLLEAIKAVFRSWDNPRATVYRRMHDIPYEWGTAVNVQAMVLVIWAGKRYRRCLYP